MQACRQAEQTVSTHKFCKYPTESCTYRRLENPYVCSDKFHSMKAAIHTCLICCWLAFMVLLGSTGFGMVEHWCQMRGHPKSLLVAKDSCAKPCEANKIGKQPVSTSGGSAVKKMPCCKTTVSYQHLDVSHFVAEQPNNPAPQPVQLVSNPQFRGLLATLLPATATVITFSLADNPLHQSGRSRLISLCTWLI